ncbi:MAG: ABC transporter substrate-binding protein [Candidatus Rokubacteria bacterium]|nr:ABC transporter substrate-binding protein [Candidatus Rokubacteria bacterium]
MTGIATNGWRRIALAVIGMAAALGLAGPAAAAEKVVFGLDWQVLGRHAGYMLALERGFYKDEGLDVEIQRGYGSADAVKRVGAGTVTFSFGDAGSLVIARTESIKVKLVAMVYGRAPHALWIRKDAGVQKPTDLEGKTIGGSAGSAVRLLFPAFAKLAGVDASKVKWLTLDAASLYPTLFSKRIDAMVDFVPGWPTVSKRAAEAKVELERMMYVDYGFTVYSNGILAREETIRDKPETVRKFVAATLKGLDLAFKSPAEAAQALKRRYPEVDEETARAEVEIVRELAWTDEAKKNGLGFMSADKMKTTRDIMTETYNLKLAVPVDDLYTNAFLPK